VTYSTHLLLSLASLLSTRPHAVAPHELDDVFDSTVQELRDCMAAFRSRPVTPAATCQFEQQLQKYLYEVDRVVLKWAYNQVEPAEVGGMSNTTAIHHLVPTTRNFLYLFGPKEVWLDVETSSGSPGGLRC